MNMIVERIPVHKHFLVIDSPIPFTLRANNGTDEVYRMAGAWRIDLYTILTEKYFKQYPVFILELVYDEDLLQPGETIEVRQSDIDFGSGIAGVNGQDVRVTNFDDLKKKYKYLSIPWGGNTWQELIDYLFDFGVIIKNDDNKDNQILDLSKIFQCHINFSGYDYFLSNGNNIFYRQNYNNNFREYLFLDKIYYKETDNSLNIKSYDLIQNNSILTQTSPIQTLGIQNGIEILISN